MLFNVLRFFAFAELFNWFIRLVQCALANQSKVVVLLIRDITRETFPALSTRRIFGFLIGSLDIYRGSDWFLDYIWV